jgi:hypothetical protein
MDGIDLEPGIRGSHARHPSRGRAEIDRDDPIGRHQA